MHTDRPPPQLPKIFEKGGLTPNPWKKKIFYFGGFFTNSYEIVIFSIESEGKNANIAQISITSLYSFLEIFSYIMPDDCSMFFNKSKLI